MPLTFTPEEMDQLTRNYHAGHREDHVPVVKLQITLDGKPLRQKFLITELLPDAPGVIYGLLDYGIFSPTLGYTFCERLLRLFEEEHPLTIERVEGWKTEFRIYAWELAAERNHTIPDDDQLALVSQAAAELENLKGRSR